MVTLDNAGMFSESVMLNNYSSLHKILVKYTDRQSCLFGPITKHGSMNVAVGSILLLSFP